VTTRDSAGHDGCNGEFEIFQRLILSWFNVTTIFCRSAGFVAMLKVDYCASILQVQPITSYEMNPTAKFHASREFSSFNLLLEPTFAAAAKFSGEDEIRASPAYYFAQVFPETRLAKGQQAAAD
jgi:hypothetical protein